MMPAMNWLVSGPCGCARVSGKYKFSWRCGFGSRPGASMPNIARDSVAVALMKCML